MAIPKTIHYCWFGGQPKPKLAQKCIRSWKKYCPDYEIVEWNENNFDVTQNLYCRQAYEAKKWAFVTDYARLKILYEYGGIYFDTDVELLRKIDDLLIHSCFMGIEKSNRVVQVATGLGMGAEKGHPLVKKLLEDYQSISFYKEDGGMDMTTCTTRNAVILKKYGYEEKDCIQKIADAVIYSSEYFSPIMMENGFMYKTRNTYSIHHYSLSWTSPEKQHSRKKLIREMKMRNLVYNIKVWPNNALLHLLGREKYKGLKDNLKKGKEI